MEWKEILKEVPESVYSSLDKFLEKERKDYKVYPAQENIYKAFELTPYEKVKVVILGQDPYHGPNQAIGLSFAVSEDVKIPPSLRNIYQELESDLGIAPPKSGDLTAWAKQGVLLLNTVLTVRAGEANSHRGKGWEEVTDHAIKALNKRDERIVFILWGRASQAKEKLIDTNKHKLIKSVHPSPLSAYRGFFGSKPFSKANELLEESGQKSIDWRL